MRSRIQRLTLTDFRSYRTAQLDAGGRSCFLFGPNGAGKTNLLEAVSLFSPGRGLRGATLGEIGRRGAGETEGRAWAVSAEVEAGAEILQLGAGLEDPAGHRRLARRSGEAVPAAAFADYLRPLWLTPALDRLFTGPASERRRFFDRLVFSSAPSHAAEVAAYERAQRERLRLLTAGPADRAWLAGLEAQAARAGARLAVARAATLQALAAEIDGRRGGPFPAAQVSFSGEWENRALEGALSETLEPQLAEALERARPRDAAAGRALTGPHRTDLAVVGAESGRPAAESSTGEQKALILNLILAQAARLSRAIDAPNPVLLLDEVAAHLDAAKRAALFDEIEALSLQAFLTGTDEALFATFRGRALAVAVDASTLTLLG